MNAARQAYLKAQSAQRKAENHEIHHGNSAAAWHLWQSNMQLFRGILRELNNQIEIPAIANSSLDGALHPSQR